MADDRKTWRKNLPEDFDGRFGKEFDDEISTKSVVQVAVGVAVVCAVTFAFTWVMMVWNANRSEASQPAPSVVAEANEARMPSGALLQSFPEAEMEALRHEMQARLHGYGWVDQAAGTVHVPIEQAMALIVEQAGVEQAGETEMTETSSDASEDATALDAATIDAATSHDGASSQGDAADQPGEHR